MSMISLPAPLLSDSPAIERFANVWGYAWLNFVDFLIDILVKNSYRYNENSESQKACPRQEMRYL